MLNIAVIGLGLRVSGMLAEMRRLDPEVQVVAVMDPSHEKARNTIREKQLNANPDAVKLFSSLEEMLEHEEKYDGFVIGTSSMPMGLRNFVELIVPELQKRGLYRKEYTGANFRENLRA